MAKKTAKKKAAKKKTAAKMSKRELKEALKKSTESLERHGFDVRVLRLDLDGKIREAIEQGRMTVEHRGHYGNGRYDLARRMKDDMRMPKCSLPDAQKINRAFKRQGGLKQFVTLSDRSCLMSCPVCDEHLAIETNAKVLRPTTDCKHPDGMVIEFELNVPSGKIVAKDDLRQWFDYLGDFNINSTMGTMQATLAMAKIGCAYGFVGNSCPGIYRQADGTYIIANGAYPKDSYDDEDYIAPEGEQVASICTDLWWYSLVDFDEFVRRAGDVTPEDAGAEVFDVKPGVYHFRQMREDLNNEEKDGVSYIYADFKWVREPDPVIDYLEEVRERNFTIGQVVHRSMSRYPSLYKPNTPEGIRAAVDAIFCTIGGGGEWHKNGFIQYDPDMPADEPETTIPKFDTAGRWYGLNAGYSAVCVGAGVLNDYYNTNKAAHMNPSFLKVAFDVARNIYLFGCNSEHVNDDEQRKLAMRCLQGLTERYPEQIPEDCKVLLMPVIDQANWVLELLETPVTFYWHETKGGRKNLRIKNEYHDAAVNLTKFGELDDNQGRREISSPGKFMSYGHAQSREAIYWASLMGQFALWIKGQEHVATDAATVPYRARSGKFIDHRCAHAKVKDGFKERLAQTSYNAKTIVLEGEKEAIAKEEKDLAKWTSKK